VLLVGLYASQNKGDGIDVSTTGVVTSTPLANTISTSGSNQGNGLSINTLGTVNLKGFTTTYNTGTGILIVNNTGTGGVTLQNVISSNNTLKGIDVTTRGPISITTATAESNTGQNASLANNTAASPQPVSITNGQFNSSTVEGLVVTSKGTITLANVNAFYNNTTSGTAAVSLTNTPGTGGVSIQNSKFDYNYATVAALNVLTDGSITLSGDEIYDNYNGKGAYLQSNTAKVNNASISNSNFSSNHLTGLDLTTNGAITLTNINSQYNLGYGVLLENDFGAKGSVTILTSGTGTNWIQSSPNDGLKIISNGSVTVKNLTSTGNTGNGISITTGNGFPVTLINITTSYNSLDGINVTDNGGVVMDQVNAIQNTGNGVILDVNPGLSKPVTVTRSSFSFNNLLGLQVVTDGLITVNNITATSNYGIASVDLENQGATALVGVNILNTYGGNTFTNNSGEGLVVKTKGNIVANGLNATGNGGAGVGLNNSYGSGTVSVNGGFFKDNAGQDTSTFIYGGLVINSNNNVTATNIQSFFNGNSGNGYGLYVNSNGHNFALSNSAILGNENSGIYAHVLPGVVTILNTTYFGNMLNGGTSNLVIN
jgi:hypothetical protein